MNIKRYEREYLKVRRLDGVDTMAVLAKPIAFAIRSDKMKEFIEESNKNTITKDFLKECREASKLFKRK